MGKVYVVHWVTYMGSEILGVFADKDVAHRAADAHRKSDEDRSRMTSYTVEGHKVQ